MADNETSISGKVHLSVDDKASKSIENIQKKTDKTAKSFANLGEKADKAAKSAKEIDTAGIQKGFEKTADAAENLRKKIDKTFGGKAKKQLQTFLLDVEDLAAQLKKVAGTNFAGRPLNSAGQNSKHKSPHENTDDWSNGIPSGLDNKKKKRIAAYLRGEQGYKNPIPENVGDTERVIAYNSVRNIGKGHTAQAEMPSLQLFEKAFDEWITPALKTNLLVKNQKQRYADIQKYTRGLFPGAAEEQISKTSLANERVLSDANKISQEALGNALVQINNEMESYLRKAIRQQIYETGDTSGILGARDRLSKNIDLNNSSDILRLNASKSASGEKSILESIYKPQKILDQFGNEIGEKSNKILTSLDLLKESIDIAKTQFSKVGKTISESDAVKAMDKIKAKPKEFAGADNSGITNLPAIRDVDKQAAASYRAEIWNTKNWTLPQSDDLTYLQSLVKEQERREKIILAQQERRAEAEKQQAAEEENRAQQAKRSNRKEAQIDERILANQTKRADAAQKNAETRRRTEERRKQESDETRNIRKWKNEHPNHLLGLSRQPRYQVGRFLNKAGDLLGSDRNPLGFVVGKALNVAGTTAMFGPLMGFGAAALGLIEGVKKLGEAILETTGKIESVKAQLEVVAGSNSSAQSLFSDISEYARKSPFGVEQTSEMAILLKQSGVYASDLMDTLKMIGDTAGGNAEKMKRIANNYAQIVSIGKASMLDMRQFAYAGIPIFEAVSKELGVSQERLRTMISDGEVTSDIIEKVFKNLTGVNGVFENATEVGARTLQARLQNLQDTKELALAGIGTMIQNVGNSNGTGGVVSGFVDFAEGLYNALSNWSEKHNIAKNIEQIKENQNGREDILSKLKYLNDNRDSLNASGIDVKATEDMLKAQLKNLEGAFSPNKKWGIFAQEYDRIEEAREKAQGLFSAKADNDKMSPYYWGVGDYDSAIKHFEAILKNTATLDAHIKSSKISKYKGNLTAEDVFKAGLSPDNIGEYFIENEAIKRLEKIKGKRNKDSLAEADYESVLNSLRNDFLGMKNLSWKYLNTDEWKTFSASLNEVYSLVNDRAVETGATYPGKVKKAQKALDKEQSEDNITGKAYETNKNSADKFTKAMDEAAKKTDSARSIIDMFAAEMKQSTKYQQEQREKQIELYKEYNSEFERLTKKYSGNGLFSKDESFKGMSVSDIAKYLTKFNGRTVIKKDSESYYDGTGKVSDYGKETWSYFQKTVPFIKETLTDYFKEQGEAAPENKAQEMLGDFTKILDIDAPTSEDFDKAAVWIRDMAENTETLSGDIRTVVQQLLMTQGNQEGQKLDLSYLEDASGKNGDTFIPLWKRILSQYTGISTNNITSTKNTLDAYGNYKSTQSMANSMFANILKESGNTKLFRELLSPKKTGNNGVFSTKGTDGKEAHVYQADWGQVRENLKKFSYSLNASVKSAELYKSALESEEDTYSNLLAAAYTVTEGPDISSTRKFITNDQIKKFTDNEAAVLFTDFGEELRTDKNELITAIRDGKLYGKDSNGKEIELAGKQIEITGNINKVITEKLGTGSLAIAEASMNVLAKKIGSAVSEAKTTAAVTTILYSQGATGKESLEGIAKNESLYLAEVLEQAKRSDKIKTKYGDENAFFSKANDGDKEALSLLREITAQVVELNKDNFRSIRQTEKDIQGARGYGQLMERLDGADRVVETEQPAQESLLGRIWDENLARQKDSQLGSFLKSSPFKKADSLQKSLGSNMLGDLGLSGDWSSLEKAVHEKIYGKAESNGFLISGDEADALRKQGVGDDKLSILQDQNAALAERAEIYNSIAEAADNAAQKDIIDKAAMEATADTLVDLKDNVKSIAKETAKNAFTASFKSVGASLIKGSEAGEDLKNNLKQIGASMLEQVGTAMTTAGFQIAGYGAMRGSAAVIAAGLALAGAGGVVAGFGGALTSDSDSEDEAEDEAKRLEDLKNDLADLLKQAREDAVYYESTLRHKKAISANESFTTQKVNDAIITPSGNVISTHPDDYLIATKTPETLAGGKGGTPTVNFQVIDKSTGIKVTQQKASYNELTNEIDYMAVIESKVQEVIATSKGDAAFSARQARLSGKTVVM